MASTAKPGSGPASKSQAGKRAIIRDAVFYCADNCQHIAPRGEYDIEQREGCVGLCSCADHNRFTLSFDAFIQHVNEGRITLVAANGPRK